jgi:protease-4
VRYLDPPASYRDELVSAFAGDDESDMPESGDAFSLLAQRPAQQLAAALDDLRLVLSGPSIQARCLECGSAMPPRNLKAQDASLITLLKDWLLSQA